MRRSSLLVTLGAIGCLAVALSARAPSPPQASSYVGSEACRRCHEPEYETWRQNLHVQMTKPIAEARVAGDFSSAKLEAGDRRYSMERRGGRYVIAIARAGQPAESFPIDYTLGARRFQGYLSTLPDGRIYVLPVFWHSETQRWLDYREITPVPDDPSHDFRQIWNVSCVNCHATNLVRNFDAARNRFQTTWTEMGIGCEACHGSGRAHIDDPQHLQIFTMKKVPPRQIFDACGYCHGNKNNVFFGFEPGDRYEDFALPFLISEPIPANDPQGDFWPDGRPSRFNRPQALTISGCFQKGEATCTSCHRMHGSQQAHSLKVAVEAPGGGHTRQSDALCTQCHVTDGQIAHPSDTDPFRLQNPTARATAIPDLAAHTHHAPASQGSRCINCHMSDVNWRLITRRLDHTFQAPVPELTAKFGVPNACTTCHEEKSPEWAAATLDRWYGNRERRQSVVMMAETFYRAGTGDTRVLADTARLAVDRSHGTLIRASAAEFAGALVAKTPIAAPGPGGLRTVDTPVMNSLIGAANDPEPTVRATAVRSLGLTLDAQAIPPITAHLVDAARVVRVRAAEALLGFGLTTLEGAAGAALTRAQDEWMESLRTFNDAASDHVVLARLLSARGQSDTARRELGTAIRLEPDNPRPHVELGIIAARAARYDEAVQHFKAAKALAPAYPNLDRLIEEAAKRR